MGQTFQMGLTAGMNPLMLTTALVFIWLLSVYRHTRGQLIIVGFSYLAIIWVVNFFVLNGNYDHLIYQPYVERLINITYGGLSVLFLYLGFVHFNDRLLLAQGKDVPMLSLPSPRSTDLSPRTGKWYRYVYLTMIFAVIAWHISIFEASLTQNYYLFVIMFQLIKADAALGRAIGSFLSYMASYTLILSVIFVVCLFDSYSMRFRSLLNRYLGLEKLILAALFWGTAVGLLFYLLNIR